MALVIILLVLVLAVFIAFGSSALPEKAARWVLPFPALLAFGILGFAGLAFVGGGQEVGVDMPWVALLEMDLSLRLTGFGLMMGLLILGIGTAIIFYTTHYLAGNDQQHLLMGYLYAFMLSMTGLVFADHLLLLFIFWEGTSIVSYLLIGFNHRDGTSRRNALQALLVTGMGGMALLAGIILLVSVSGTWELSGLVDHREAIIGHPLYPAILLLVLLGAMTKSAQFPFHFWLPNAMAAPTPISAYLHSATMVKAGIYLLAVMLPILGGTPLWTYILLISGCLTFFIGGISGILENDLKRVLAGTTLSVLGLLTLLIGIGTEATLLAVVLLLLAHALYKAVLFMVVGAIDHQTGTRDARRLRGLAKVMPWTAAIAAIAAFSKMGLPPFVGFLGKEYLYKSSLLLDYAPLLTGLLIAGNIILFALAAKVAAFPFWAGKEADSATASKEAHWVMWLAPLVLAVTGLAIGLFPGLIKGLVAAAVSTAMGYPASPSVKLWQGVNLPLLLSVLTVLLGVALSVWIHRARNPLALPRFPSADAAYDGMIKSILKFGVWQTRLLQSGLLRNYLMTIIVATLVLVVAQLWRFGGIEEIVITGPGTPQLWSLTILMLGGITISVTASSRLTALIGLGVVGFGMAFLFAHFSAPDLAITQILIETLTVALFAWVVYKLPAFQELSSRRSRLIDALVSITAGVLVSIIVLKSKALEMSPGIAATLSAWSQPEANGANVVNVILVDFRALDTFGEITVLGIAALGVWGLFQKSTGKKAGKVS